MIEVLSLVTISCGYEIYYTMKGASISSYPIDFKGLTLNSRGVWHGFCKRFYGEYKYYL